MAGGRPTLYNDEMAAKICQLVATHRYGLKRLCAMFDEIPEHITINEWRWRYPEFAAQYLQAKRAQIDLAIEDIDDIIDENLRFYIDDKGNERIDSPSATIAIAKANKKQWEATRLLPALYGDKKEESKSDSESVLEKILKGEIQIKND